MFNLNACIRIGQLGSVWEREQGRHQVRLLPLRRGKILLLILIMGAASLAIFRIVSTLQQSNSPRLKRLYLGDQLVDLHGFKMEGEEENCRKSSQTMKLLYIAVHSSRRNYNRRSAIRNTWASVKTYKDWQISVNFLLGSPPFMPRPQDQVITQVVENEVRSHGDMVVGSFVDSYRNLTYKHMMGYKWILESCPQVDVYIKTDDDVFVNVPRIIEWLSRMPLEEDRFYCYVLRGYSPWRSRRYKFYISKDEYRPDKFPDYCSGVGYIAKPGLLWKLYGVSTRLKFLWVEDLFATGLLPNYFNRYWKSVHELPSSDLPKGGIHLNDISKLYLNEQYAFYKGWIDDVQHLENPWFFILLKKDDEHEMVLDQQTLWRKTAKYFGVTT